MIFLLVLSFLDLECSVADTTPLPSFACPKTTCLSYGHSVLALQVKNWELLCWIQRLPWTDAGTRTLQGENLIINMSSLRWTCHLCPVLCEVTALAHVSWDKSVKAGTIITKPSLPRAQSTKVFCCLWSCVCK